ncbi:MAG TPA: 6-phosphogluconolactonase [Chitinophagaceae bacterium]|nr:6-phosphogluconolactonase [Chitinophagaceae bacterium]
MQIHQEKDLASLSQSAATWIANLIKQTLVTQDRFTWALSGGNTPKILYHLLTTFPYRDQIPWEKLHLFFGDERHVPFSDSRNNGNMAYHHLISMVPVPLDQIYYMRTDIAPEESALEYERLLHRYFDGKKHSFDLVLLGMGEDGHTLSLFPGTKVIFENKNWVLAYYVATQQMYRITLTPAVVNQSSAIAFLVTGSDKAGTLKEVLQGKNDPARFPSQIIQPQDGELHWFIDQDAGTYL